MSAEHDRHDVPPLELAVCPECGGVAEVVTRFSLGSTDGPVEHVRLVCVMRHGFVMPAQRVTPWPVADPVSTAPGTVRRPRG